MESKARSWVLLFVALGIGALAFWLANRYLAEQELSLRAKLNSEKVKTKTVVVATVDVNPGDVAGPHNMAIAEVPSEFLSSAAVVPNQFENYQGQVIRHFMTPGEPLLSHFVAGLGIERFADLLKPGERAVTIDIDNINSVSGMLLPGDFVDLMLASEDTKQEPAVEQIIPLLQRVRILSVDKVSLVSRQQDFIAAGMGADSINYGSVTVGVNFEDAASLILAKKLGEIVFMLRNREDKRYVSTGPISQRTLQSKSNQSQYQLITAGGDSAKLKSTAVAIESLSNKKKSNSFGKSIKLAMSDPVKAESQESEDGN